ncbi:hypothetical protein Plhal304r1_c001g0002701 [Plasmopara halstedii]
MKPKTAIDNCFCWSSSFVNAAKEHKTSLGKEQLEDRNKQGNSMLRYRFLFHG